MFILHSLKTGETNNQEHLLTCHKVTSDLSPELQTLWETVHYQYTAYSYTGYSGSVQDSTPAAQRGSGASPTAAIIVDQLFDSVC